MEWNRSGGKQGVDYDKSGNGNCAEFISIQEEDVGGS